MSNEAKTTLKTVNTENFTCTIFFLIQLGAYIAPILIPYRPWCPPQLSEICSFFLHSIVSAMNSTEPLYTAMAILRLIHTG